MKCPRCENEIAVGAAQKISSKGCQIISNPTTVLTVKCSNCGEIFQVSTSVKSMFVVKKESRE